jgi:Flp pilus assembly protein TadG
MRMLTAIKRRVLALRREHGQAVVELALVLPVLLAIVFGGIYLSRYFNWGNNATQLAGEGARLAAVNSVPSCTGAADGKLTSYLTCKAGSQGNGFKNAISSGNGKVCVSFPSGTTNVGDPVTITVTVDYPSVKLPLGLGTVGPGFKSKAATMRIEQAVDTTKIATVC